MYVRGKTLQNRREGYREKRTRRLSQDSINDRGHKELFQPFIAVHAHDYEIGTTLLDLLWNNLSWLPRHNETLNRWSCGHIWHDVFKTLVQQCNGAIQVVRQACPSLEGG